MRLPARTIRAHPRAPGGTLGGDPGKGLPPGWDARDAKTGAPPGIDRGWAYAPGARVAEQVLALKDRLPDLPAQIGAEMFATLPVAIQQGVTADFGAFVDRALSQHVQGNYQVVGALKPAWINAARAHGVMPVSAEVAVTDLNVQHTFRGTGLVTAPTTKRRTGGRQPKVAPLDLDWYRDLPMHLRNPRAVLLDATGKEPVFILVHDVPGSTAKLVVEINTWVKKAKGRLNTVQTGRLIERRALMNDIGRGVIVVDGEV